MSKGKPRHNPDKKQNKYGGECVDCEVINGKFYCMYGAPSHIVEQVCKGNPHNCSKVQYRQWAGKDSNKDYPSIRRIIDREDYNF